MEADHGRQIDLRQHVAVEHDHRIRDVRARVLDRAASAQRLRLHDVPKRDADRRSVPEDLFDCCG